jgi:hypothetical protein
MAAYWSTVGREVASFSYGERKIHAEIGSDGVGMYKEEARWFIRERKGEELNDYTCTSKRKFF